jgi:predicted DNA-binding protein (MmcQ/YjbR family)
MKELNTQKVKEYCLTKTVAFEDFPFGAEPLVIKVGSKMFAIISKDSISLKCDPFVAQNLRSQYSSVKPGYHLNKQHWNTVELSVEFPDSEMTWMIDHSYDLVYSKLSNKELQLLQNIMHHQL